MTLKISEQYDDNKMIQNPPKVKTKEAPKRKKNGIESASIKKSKTQKNSENKENQFESSKF